jgi:aspartate aminotransferase-like enzyme
VTASGTGLMEMAVTNLLDPGDHAVVFNGGTFGQRWVDLCRAFGVEVSEIQTDLGKTPDLNRLVDALKQPVDAVLVNMHETSTGYLYDVREIGRLVQPSGALFIVDGISAIGADEFKMDEWGVDCALVGSQKALAVTPGLGYIAFNPRAMARAENLRRGRYYFNVVRYARDLRRGMTPFTPAVAAILQLQERMRQIRAMTLEGWIRRHADKAALFRKTLFETSAEFSLFPERSSNAMSAVTLPQGVGAAAVVEYMRDKYDWWFTPNGTGSDQYLRVSHMGHLSDELMRLCAVRLTEAAQEIREGVAAA